MRVGDDGSLALYHLDTSEMYYYIYNPAEETAPDRRAALSMPEKRLVPIAARRR